MTTRYGRPTAKAKCPNKQCRDFGRGMDDIGSRDYINLICQRCGCHYDGEVGKPLKFWTKKEWETAIETAWENDK